MLQSDINGTPRTLAVTTLTAGAADYDFRDIVITGAAAPLSVTRAGDCKGNSGITFPAAKTVYYRQTGSFNWGQASPGSWSLTSGGAFDNTAFPLAQDTAVFPAATYPASGSTTFISNNYNIGTIDMSLRTANTMILSMTTGNLTIYGNWINGTGITLSGTAAIISFSGRGNQTITSAGRTFTQIIATDSPGGTVRLLDNLTNNNTTSFSFLSGTFSANGYNVNLPFARVTLATTGVRTVDFGSGTWDFNFTGTLWSYTGSNLSVSGNGIIYLSSGSAKTFQGGGIQTYPRLLTTSATGTTIAGNNGFSALEAGLSPGTISLTSGSTNRVSSINTTGVSALLLNTSAGTTATIRASVRVGNATLSGPLVLGAS
jgi:hypothetical protein